MSQLLVLLLVLLLLLELLVGLVPKINWMDVGDKAYDLGCGILGPSGGTTGTRVGPIVDSIRAMRKNGSEDDDDTCCCCIN